MIQAMKEIEFCGTSLDDLREFNQSVRHEMGQQLLLVQNGFEPRDWKPMTTIGAGVKEIRVKDVSGAYRAVYIAKLPDAVYVLHCFQKKTQATAKQDIDIAKTRLAEVMRTLAPVKIRRIK